MLDVDNWEKYIPLMMFACNNSYLLTFGMQPLTLSMVGSVSPPIIGKGLENEDYWALMVCNIIEFVEANWELDDEM